MENFKPKYFSRSCGACNSTGRDIVDKDMPCLFCHSEGRVELRPEEHDYSNEYYPTTR